MTVQLFPFYLRNKPAPKTEDPEGSGSPADAEAALDAFIREAGPDKDAELVGYLYRRARREEQLWRGALGAGETAVFQPLR